MYSSQTMHHNIFQKLSFSSSDGLQQKKEIKQVLYDCQVQKNRVWYNILKSFEKKMFSKTKHQSKEQCERITAKKVKSKNNNKNNSNNNNKNCVTLT